MNAPTPQAAFNQRTLVQRALGGHAAIGLLVGALIYIIALSGSIVVIHDRWQRWEQPNIADVARLSPPAAQAAMTAVFASDRGKPTTTHLYIRMPTDDLPRAVVTTDHGAWYVDDAGHMVGKEAHAWTEFVIALHEHLTMPETWGRILVVALCGLVVTGVVAHPRILRDAFRLRTRHDAQIARADWHNRLGVWTLPFVLAVALTGAFIGLGSIGATVLAKAYTGGDIAKIYAPIFGDDPPANAVPAGLPDIATALATLAARVPTASPTYVTVHDPATAGQHVQILADHPRRLIYGESYVFDGSGRWLGPVGLADGALGKQASASAYNLHFGNYGGLAVEIAYMVFGLALCVITATGTSLWLQKRRRRGLGDPRLTAAWDVVIWGVPLALVAIVWLRAVAGAEAPLTVAFWGLLAAGLAIAAIRPVMMSATWLRPGLWLAIVATAALHLLVLRPTALPVIALDGVAIIAAMLALVAGRRRVVRSFAPLHALG